MNNFISLCISVLLIISCIFKVNAQEVQVIRPLTFGKVAIIDNSTQGSIKVDYLGNATISSHFAVLERPTAAIFRLVGYPVNATLFVEGGIIQAQTSSPQMSPEQFTLTSVITPVSVNIESDGTAEFGVGGELQTSGSGNLTFGNQSYTARLLITVDY